MVNSWIFQENLAVFLAMLAWIAGYPIDQWDIDAVVTGIDGTDEDGGRWFDYEFSGEKRTIKFQVADDPGSSVFHFRVSAPDEVSELVDLTFFVGSSNKVQRHSSS